MMQGDAYKLPFAVTNNGVTVVPDMVSTIEFTIGTLTRNYPDTVTYKDGWYLFPLTQEETFALAAKKQPYQVRVKFTDGSVVGASGEYINVEASLSKGVL